MKHIFAALAAMVLLVLSGCGQQVPPVANGIQGWGKGEPYVSLRNATIRGAASGSWVSKKYEKMDYRELQKLSKAEQEALIAAGFDPWTGSFRQTASLTPYRVEALAIADGVSQGKTFDSKGKEVPLTCVISSGAGLFREAKKTPAPTTTFGAFFPRAPEYVEQAPSTVIITACAKPSTKGGWELSHIVVEKPKKTTEGGN